jgi:alanine racemase
VKGLIRAEVSAAALRANLARVREAAPGTRVMAVVKANAYGHGLVPTASCLADADAFGVARLEEALALRGADIRTPIVLLEGVFDAEELAEAARHDLQIVVHDSAQIALLERAGIPHRFVVWLKADTGMNRLGFPPGGFAAALARLTALGPRLREIRLLTHFACADSREAVMTSEQLGRFEALARDLPYARSLANSAAVFAFPGAHGDWVRPGLALYGVSPFAGTQGASLGLVPAMRLLSTVISLRDVPAGQTVGYGSAWRAARDSRIAIVAAGYGDGLPWALSNGASVLVNRQLLPLAGRVSMDMIAVDVTGFPARIGDEVQLWGAELPVETQARAAGTIPWELLCAVSQRVPLLVT